MSQSDIGTPAVGERFTGRVKWFNNKSGYGFITQATTKDDIFVHHSSIVVADQQYKYLVQGEYVEFTLAELSNGKHKYQATDISGIARGQLMCETRREIRASRPKATGDKRSAKARGPGPREDQELDASAQSKDDMTSDDVEEAAEEE